MKLLPFLIAILTISLGIAQENLLQEPPAANKNLIIYKDQPRGSTHWGEVDLDSFLSFKKWKEATDEKALIPEWESIVRDRDIHERVGQFFQCHGVCRVDRGKSFFNPSFRSSLYEGDEIQTVGDSYAWIFLLDGTMVRLSPDSSINLSEINIGAKENFIHARINVGNVLWLSRSESLFEEVNARETDVLFFPLSLYEANPIQDKKKYNENSLIDLVEENQTNLNQYKNLNSLITENNKLTKSKPTYAFIVIPNMTLMGLDPNVEIVSLLGGKTYFKKRSAASLGLVKDSKEEDLFLQRRGFENNELTKVDSDEWQEMDESGRNSSKTNDYLNWLTMGEFITKRIPSFMVARELMLQKYSAFAFQTKYDPILLASEDGYRLWGNLSDNKGKKSDMFEHLEFLKEYYRRIETTNLTVSSHFRNRLKERGQELRSMQFGNFFFIKALDKYYSYESYTDDNETGEVLNSTTKLLWKKMHGIR